MPFCMMNDLCGDKEEEEDLFVQRQDIISYGSWLYIYTHIGHMFTLI